MSKPDDSSEEQTSSIDPKAYQESLERLGKIFTGMVQHADEVSKFRCPYRDRMDFCTAKFKCRNQISGGVEEAPETCGHDGVFDFRSAWESDPGNYQRAKDKIAKSGQHARRERALQKRGSPKA